MDEFILPDGTRVKLGNIPATPRVKWTVYGDVPETPMIPRSKWDLYCDPAREMDPDLPYVHDQDGVGQCNADATAALAELQRARQGLPFVKLSAADLYDRINGGQDQGSMLEDGIRELMGRGIGTADTSPTIWKRGLPVASDAERARFKALECFLCPTFDHCFSASICGFGIVSGVMWYNNYNPDPDGWLPLIGRGSGGGHAVLGFAPAKRGKDYGIWHQNSWTTKWGRNGRGVFPETMYKGPVGGWWACRSMTDEGGNAPVPQP